MSDKPPADYTQYYSEEPIRFRGLGQGTGPNVCGRTQVEMGERRGAPRTPPGWSGFGQEAPAANESPFTWLKHCDVPDEEFNTEQLRRGTAVEKEHTDKEGIAKCIAKAHLLESPDYYRELEKMERRLGRRRKQFAWRRTGEGCNMGTAAAGMTHPCDVEYENVETGQRIVFETTAQAHAKMPKKARTVEKLDERKGVRRR